MYALFGCTEKTTTYSPYEGEIQWAWFDKDSIKAVGFSIRVHDDTPGAIASTEMVTRFGELDYYKFIDINFVGLKQDTTRMDVSLTDKDYNQIFHIAKSNWESVIRQWRAIENIEDTLTVSLRCERQYKLSSFRPNYN